METAELVVDGVGGIMAVEHLSAKSPGRAEVLEQRRYPGRQYKREKQSTPKCFVDFVLLV